ncbi:hypothetical protein ACJMK2_010997 [Sinanodonta woodiana]|uniref:Alpha/beta hydrolase fold-3 domain-containing protein n=1 Tax=Sinanodonta woodiana TaxID=1069815 RepID=A0ABD3V3L4_SINWO
MCSEIMTKVFLWTLVLVILGIFLNYYTDTPVPKEIPEKWKVRIIDASMRTYSHIISFLVKLGITTHFSFLDRKLSDWFILTQMTGYPWGLSLTADPYLRINDTVLNSVRVKVYEPLSTIRFDRRPALVYIHGGGWSLLSVDSYDPLMRKIARDSGVVIFSVDYRLSPQYPYPEPLNDCLAVVNYVIAHARELHIDPARIAVGGDSAGGNMAASISLRIKHKISLQLLLVPVLQSLNFNTTSFIENTKYFSKSINNPQSVVFITNYIGISPEYVTEFLINNHTSPALKSSHFAHNADQRRWLPSKYVRSIHLRSNIGEKKDYGNEDLSKTIESTLIDPYFAPMMAEDDMLRDLPETYIMTCAYDIVRDDGIMFSERLKAVGTPYTLVHYNDGFHNALMFPHGPLKLDVSDRIVKDLVRKLRKL